MAIEKMEMVSVTGEYAMLDRIIEAYLDSGCFQPEAASQIVNNLKGFTHINDENPYAARFAKIAEIFSSCDVPLDNAASSETRLSDGQINEKLDIFERRIGALQNRRKDLTLEISNIETSISRLEHFVNFDFKLHEIFKSEFIKIRIGRLPAESFEKLQFYNSNPYVLFFPCSNEGDYLWGIYVSPADSGDEVGNIFASLFFERLDIP
ncbi:MAG: hypothetical protein FWF08_04280, partial [Oscillospiraceae bacterium]|nr:hypothetical protein [Oscillospiraceae bacterium]